MVVVWWLLVGLVLVAMIRLWAVGVEAGNSNGEEIRALNVKRATMFTAQNLCH